MTTDAGDNGHTPLLTLAPGQAAPPGYRLVWSDEFNGDGMPDPGKWSYDDSRNASGWGGTQLQYYSSGRRQNVRIVDGKLVIEARQESLSNNLDYGGQSFSSGRLVTRDKKYFTYGFFDIRAKLPCGRGQRPGIWMIGSSERNNGEIDIMQHAVAHSDQVSGTVHTPHTRNDGVVNSGTTSVPGLCRYFHDYQMEWTPDRITFLVDGLPYYHLSRNGQTDPYRWPFTAPEYLILNLAIAGYEKGGGVDESAFPAQMQVDYVRVYQRP